MHTDLGKIGARAPGSYFNGLSRISTVRSRFAPSFLSFVYGLPEFLTVRSCLPRVSYRSFMVWPEYLTV